MAANSLWYPMNFLGRPRIETRDATTTYITVTVTAPIIFSVVMVTMTAESGNSQLAAPAHEEHTILSGRGSSFNALVDDGNVIFELYSGRNFGFGQWFSFDSVCNQ